MLQTDYAKFTELRDAFENGEDVIGKTVNLRVNNSLKHVEHTGPFQKDLYSMHVGSYYFENENGTDITDLNGKNEDPITNVIFKVTNTWFASDTKNWHFVGECSAVTE